jgi:hypothetical protein
LGDALDPDAELVAPDSMPYGEGVFRGRERIARWFAEDPWGMWAEFSERRSGGEGAFEELVERCHGLSSRSR